MGIVKFDEVRIDQECGTLTIEVSIPNEEYFEDVYIKDFLIDNQDTYVGNGYPSCNPIFPKVEANLELLSKVYNIKADSFDKPKRVKIVLTSKDIDLKGILFIYVRVEGMPKPNTPCGKDGITSMHTVTNLYPFYQQGMNFVKELSDNCSVPSDFIDWYLRVKAMQLSIHTGNYTEAIKYYNKFFKNSYTVTKKGGCGCGNT